MARASILLVEDNQVLCEVLVRNLRARGHSIFVAHDVASAQATLKACKINLILLDINLPDSTGWDLLRSVSSSPEFRVRRIADGRLPVVILSAVRVSNARLEEFRPLAYLTKPFPLEAVLRLTSQAAPRLDMPGLDGDHVPEQITGPPAIS